MKALVMKNWHKRSNTLSQWWMKKWWGQWTIFMDSIGC